MAADGERTPVPGTDRAALNRFIADLRRRATPTTSTLPSAEELDSAARQFAADSDLPEVFRAAAAANGAQVHRCTTDDWTSRVFELLGERKTARALLVPVPGSPLEDSECASLRVRFSELGIEPVDGVDDETMFAADAVVTGADLAVAETGSIVWSVATDRPRGASLIPPLHVAVVGVEQLVPDLCDVIEPVRRLQANASNVTLISGPSKTADIEGTLVTGVHGPGELHVLLVE